MNFDEVIDRHGTHCVKWDMMEQLYGVPEADGLAMWVADMDFKAPDCVQKAIKAQLEHGIYGYFGDEGPYRLIGCGLSDLCKADGADISGDLLDPNATQRSAAERATDKIRARFGNDAILKGRALR